MLNSYGENSPTIPRSWVSWSNSSKVYLPITRPLLISENILVSLSKTEGTPCVPRAVAELCSHVLQTSQALSDNGEGKCRQDRLFQPRRTGKRSVRNAEDFRRVGNVTSLLMALSRFCCKFVSYMRKLNCNISNSTFSPSQGGATSFISIT